MSDEQLHPIDPDDWSWNESWFFSFIDHHGGPAGFFRIGLLPNQDRAMLWAFIHVDGDWLALEETRLPLGDVEVDGGALAYDKWGLRFGWTPEQEDTPASLSFSGEALVRSGPHTGAYLAVDMEVGCTGSDAPVPMAGSDDGRISAVPHGRFEQPLVVTGKVDVAGMTYTIDAGGHRDKAWGHRDWRQSFAMGDLQAPGRQLFFVGRTFPGIGMGFIRDANGIRHLLVTDGAIDFDDPAHTIGSARLHLEGDGEVVDVAMHPITPSVSFDLAGTCDPPEQWIAYRTLVEATVTGWDEPCRGWFDTGRYGATSATGEPA